MSDDMDGFEREIDELIGDAERWLNSLDRGPGPNHVERLTGYEARAADIERRIIGMNSSAFADLLVRATRIRANLDLLSQKATGQVFGPGLHAALQACRDALAGLETFEQRAALTLLMAEIAAKEAADGGGL